MLLFLPGSRIDQRIIFKKKPSQFDPMVCSKYQGNLGMYRYVQVQAFETKGRTKALKVLYSYGLREMLAAVRISY